MFKQVKSIFIWSLLYKFRRRFVTVVILLSIVLLSQWIYSDIVEFLILREITSYLNIILPLKWLIIFFNIGLSAYLMLSIFKPESTQEKKKEVTQKIKNKDNA